jgi:hypothetical protein
MQKTDWLSISFDRHASNESFRGGFEDFDPHLLIECSAAALTNNVEEIWLRHSWGVYT